MLLSTSKQEVDRDKKYIVDTNVLLDNPNIIKEYNCIILACVLSELDKHKNNRDKDLRYRTREVCRTLIGNRDIIEIDMQDYDTYLSVDDEIIHICLERNLGLLTSDLYLYFKASELGIDVILPQSSDEVYVGHKTIELNDEELAELYQTMNSPVELFTNQYLVIKCRDIVVDSLRWNGSKLVKLKHKPINKIKSINNEQRLLFDMLQNKDITIKACFGELGSGKDYIMLNHALNQIDAGKFDKLVWARNNVGTKGVPQIGFLPGNLYEKSEYYLAPLVDHLGEDRVNSLMSQGKIELQHLSMIRGRDIKNSIIYVTECQNTTREIMALLITRMAEGTQLWVNGDIKQTDNALYDTNSGILALQRLKGQEKYGQVDLVHTERSETAKLAALLYG